MLGRFSVLAVIFIAQVFALGQEAYPTPQTISPLPLEQSELLALFEKVTGLRPVHREVTLVGQMYEVSDNMKNFEIDIILKPHRANEEFCRRLHMRYVGSVENASITLDIVQSYLEISTSSMICDEAKNWFTIDEDIHNLDQFWEAYSSFSSWMTEPNIQWCLIEGDAGANIFSNDSFLGHLDINHLASVEIMDQGLQYIVELGHALKLVVVEDYSTDRPVRYCELTEIHH